MIFTEEPTGFKYNLEIVGCFLENEGKFLLLHRVKEESQGNTWGVPGGKVEKGEHYINATCRELLEETGIKVPYKKMRYWGRVFVRYPESDFIYHISSAKYVAGNQITLNPKEHKDYRWVTPKEALGMNLILDEDACIKLFYKVIYL
jgi:8-oxo-dGTP pyrophosphatase MutT (NUDIX family)